MRRLGWPTGSLGKLEEIEIRDCRSLKNDAVALSSLQSARKVQISLCPSWRTLDGVEDLHALEELLVNSCE